MRSADIRRSGCCLLLMRSRRGGRGRVGAAAEAGAGHVCDPARRPDRRARRSRSAAAARARAGRELDYYAEYLDLARFPDNGYQTAVRDFLRLKYQNQRFDVVIVRCTMSRSNSSRGAANDLFPGTPVIYLRRPVHRRRRELDGAGRGHLNFAGTVTLVAALQPEVRQVFVVTGADRRDASVERRRPRSSGIRAQAHVHIPAGPVHAELERRLSSLPADTTIYYVLVNRDGNGENFHPLEYLERRRPESRTSPVYCWVDSAMARGIVGGSLKDQTVQLKALGQLAVRVLRGESADRIPVSSPDLNVRQVDWRQLRRWRIDEARVPQGTAVLFREPRSGIVTSSISSALRAAARADILIAGLLVQRTETTADRGQVARQRRRSCGELRPDPPPRLAVAAGPGVRARSHRARTARRHQPAGRASVDRSGTAERSGSARQQIACRRSTAPGARRRHEHPRLSHRLHPAKLRLIGLVSALEALQRELSRSDLTVTLTHEHVPANLPHDLTLSVFRIVQEALQNALKYSRARSVIVHLRGGPDSLALTVSDDGVGFDVETAWGKGLGLISISERIEAAGGTLDIRLDTWRRHLTHDQHSARARAGQRRDSRAGRMRRSGGRCRFCIAWAAGRE